MKTEAFEEQDANAYAHGMGGGGGEEGEEDAEEDVEDAEEEAEEEDVLDVYDDDAWKHSRASVLSDEGVIGLDYARMSAHNCLVRTADGQQYAMQTPGLVSAGVNGEGLSLVNGCAFAQPTTHPLLQRGVACSLPVMLGDASVAEAAIPPGTIAQARQDLPPGTRSCVIQFDRSDPPTLEQVEALDKALMDRAARMASVFQNELQSVQDVVAECNAQVLEREAAISQLRADMSEQARMVERQRAAAVKEARDAHKKRLADIQQKMLAEAQSLERVFQTHNIPEDQMPDMFRSILASARKGGVISSPPPAPLPSSSSLLL